MEELKKGLYEALNRFYNGYEMSDYEKLSFALACMYLSNINGWYSELLEGINKINIPIHADDVVLEKCVSFSDVIKNRLSEILLNTNVDQSLLNEENIYDCFNLKLEILNFYKKFDPKHFKEIRELVFDNERFKIIPHVFYATELDEKHAASTSFNNKGYVFMATGINEYKKSAGLSKIFVPNGLVHELGHIISFNYSSKHKIVETVFKEAIPYIAEYSYLKANKNKTESAKEYFSTLNILTDVFRIQNKRNFLESEMRYYYYIVGYSIGLYLSHLYTSNPIKFRKYYNFIKENIYIDDDKIIELFLNNEDFLKMDYLKQDIIENKKILLK